jgi:hypothetical protein
MHDCDEARDRPEHAQQRRIEPRPCRDTGQHRLHRYRAVDRKLRIDVARHCLEIGQDRERVAVGARRERDSALAPSERRIAISCWRCAPRTSKRFATFVQTISSTAATATTSTRSAGTTRAVVSSS